MKRTSWQLGAVLGGLCLFAGCLSPAPEPPKAWTFDIQQAGVVAGARGKAGPSEKCRVASVTVRAPFDGQRFAVLRKDGSIAFDPCNVFASSPSSLLKGAVQDVLAQSGIFAAVMNSSTRAATELAAEVTVTRLALDAQGETLSAAVVLDFALMKGREIVKLSTGEALVPVEADGNYTRSFSTALAAALYDALKEIPAE